MGLMAKKRYGIPSLHRQFPDDDACLDFLFGILNNTGKCFCGGIFSRIPNRRQFQCSRCRLQIAPTSGTIFHKSVTPLTLWFHAIMLYLNAKSDISAKTMERELEVSYKTAWRMLTLMRESLKTNRASVAKDDFEHALRNLISAHKRKRKR